VLRQWLDAGAVGINTGLDYPPAAHSTTRELVELAKVVAAHDGVYASHMRYQGLGRPDALREAAEIGRQASLPINVSHESIDDTTEPVHETARKDVDFAFDWYVYPAGSSHLLVNMPPEDQVGGIDGVLARLGDPSTRARFAALAEDYLTGAYATGAREYFSDTPSGRHIGRSIAEIATERGRPLGATAVDLLEEEAPDALLVFRRGMSEEQFDRLARRTITHPGYTVASDGIYHGARPHPRGFGCYARFLREWVREKRVVTLEDAIRKMSGGPAERFRIRDRGRIAEGLAADLVILDPETVSDHATWEEPRLRPTGIDAVLVNGRVVVEGGNATGELPGRVVRRQDR
jgi:N-acyl-D-amino-acid deacylase